MTKKELLNNLMNEKSFIDSIDYRTMEDEEFFKDKEFEEWFENEFLINELILDIKSNDCNTHIEELEELGKWQKYRQAIIEHYPEEFLG